MESNKPLRERFSLGKEIIFIFILILLVFIAGYSIYVEGKLMPSLEIPIFVIVLGGSLVILITYYITHRKCFYT